MDKDDPHISAIAFIYKGHRTRRHLYHMHLHTERLPSNWKALCRNQVGFRAIFKFSDRLSAFMLCHQSNYKYINYSM